jgi:hypothetical protein
VKHPHRWIIVLFVLMAAFIAPSLLASAPTGAGPLDPLSVPTGSQTIAPNATLWFYFDYVPTTGSTGRFGFRAGRITPSNANVALDAGGIGGLEFSIYTPDEATNWLNDSSTEPVGRGTPYYDKLTGVLVHDLYWSGAFNTSGRYFVAVTNTNSIPVNFQLTVTGDTVTLYPAPTPVPSPTLFVPITVTPVPTGTVQGKFVFETATGGEIYTVNGDGSNLALVSHGIDPAWSPDGTQITFARWDNTAPGVYIANADGSNERIIYTSPRVRSPRWSPDGKYIAFTQQKTTNSGEQIWKLGVVEVATGKLFEPQCSRNCYLPSWNSDSMTLAFFDPSVGIEATNIFSGPPWTILGPTGSYFDSAANIWRPILAMPPMQSVEWSPDGKSIVYSQQAHDRWEVSTVSPDGSNVHGVTSPDPILSIFFNVVDHNVAPTWSPDSKQIAFLSSQNGKWEFFVVNADGTGLTQVLKNVTDSISLQYGYSYERMIDWTK